ncbi:MAG: hypothetical protein HUJ88_12860 [Fusobacterium necrophorum]|nr:hypothetical protein [Fusobacterium necrophorum]
MILNIEETKMIERINNRIRSIDFFNFFLPIIEALEKKPWFFSISFLFLTKKEMSFFQQNQKKFLSGELDSFFPQKEWLNICFIKERESFEKRIPNKVYLSQ